LNARAWELGLRDRLKRNYEGDQIMQNTCVWPLRAGIHNAVCAGILALSSIAFAQSDPGPRMGAAAAGNPIRNLTPGERVAFENGKTIFQEVDSVTGTLSDGSGLGPRFNMDSCSGCHAFPEIGGSSPQVNPQIAVATKAHASNTVPPFITLTGPVREARFVRSPADASVGTGMPDGGVNDLFTIVGRTDAPKCTKDTLKQPDFIAAAAAQNLVFRIPTPLFGAGLIEAIDDATILANMHANVPQKAALGIAGHENTNANDGSLTRFGWKAQNKSLTIFAGEAYNVEQGVTNDVFPNEREGAGGCRFNATPEDHVDVNGARPNRPGPTASDLINFVFFMRFLAPPTPVPSATSTNSGQSSFNSAGCALCHTPSLQTSLNITAALSNTSVNLFSDLLVHNMGTGLADGISQGKATGNEFRTAPLWGLGQRLFFLHDGRTSDLTVAIAAHSSPGSEANRSIEQYKALTLLQKQELLRFLRSL
jgi:CxxC motif-containing protein (DUF1111 family)